LNAPSFYRVFVCAVGLLSPSLLLATSSHAHLASPGHTSPKPQITTTSLTGGMVGLAYSQTLAVAGGSAPYTWQIKSGSLPAGISLASYGTISGWPTAAGSSAFTVAVSDANGRSASTSLTLTVVAPPTITTTGLPGGIAGAAYSAAVQGTGGTAPYSWSIASGSLPPGLILASTTGLISGMPSGSGMYNLNTQMTDINGLSASKAFLMTIVAALNITAASLPSGSTGAAYNATLTASGGTTPYSWSVVSGQLPPGLALNTTSGIISGTPTAAGTYNLGVQVSDAASQSASKIFSVLIGVGACISCQSPLTITSTSLPAGSINTSYNATLTASGGTTPYTWSVSSGQLPVGITLASSGAISGTPTTAGSYGFTLQAADSAGHQTSQAYTVSIGSPTGSLGILTNDLHLAYINQPYDAVLTASGGLAPYLWSVSSGQLPAGLSLNTITGHISGTPTQGGQFSVTLTARDALLAQGSKTFNLEVFEQPTDQYGGLTNLACPNGPQPHFYTQKIGSRWHLCTPAGYAFFMNGIYHVIANDTGTDYQGIVENNVIQTKYVTGSTPNYELNWCLQTAHRMQGWGFNTTAEDSYSYMWPVATHYQWGTSDNTIPVKLPFVVKLSPDIYSLTNTNGYANAPVKDILAGIKTTVYNGYRSHLPDFLDPNYQQWLQNDLINDYWPHQAFTGPHNDYLVGFDVEESDDMEGFGIGTDFPTVDVSITGAQSTVSPAPHVGWLVLVTAETQTSNSNYGITYTNMTVYAKQALSNWLATRYSSNIATLNAAWGSNYSTFGSTGGWGTGTGLLDEDGTCPAKTTTCWVPTDAYQLSGATSQMKQDLDDFLLYYADKYYSMIKATLQAQAPGFLYLGTASIGSWGGPPRRQILQAASKYLDVFTLGGIPPFLCANCTDAQQRIDFVAQWGGDKPWLNWTGFQARADSYMSPYAQSTDYLRTQADRGQLYQQMLQQFLNASDSLTGTYHIVGLQWWGWDDQRSESANWGLVTPRDDPYDGTSATMTLGADSWGYPTGCLSGFGCEQANYSSFLGPVREANLSTFRYISTHP